MWRHSMFFFYFLLFFFSSLETNSRISDRFEHSSTVFVCRNKFSQLNKPRHRNLAAAVAVCLQNNLIDRGNWFCVGFISALHSGRMHQRRSETPIKTLAFIANQVRVAFTRFNDCTRGYTFVRMLSSRLKSKKKMCIRFFCLLSEYSPGVFSYGTGTGTGPGTGPDPGTGPGTHAHIHKWFLAIAAPSDDSHEFLSCEQCSYYHFLLLI